MSRRFDKSFARIDKILSAKFTDLSKRMETIEYYRTYLAEQLELPALVCGCEDFPWEEFYVMGPGDKQEYEMLKRTKASYTDILKMTSVASACHSYYGVFARVTRISDNKKFKLPLADLKGIDKRSELALLIDDYLTWFFNY